MCSPTNSKGEVDRSIKSLLNDLTARNFRSISDQVVVWASLSVQENDEGILFRISQLIFEKAVSDVALSHIYARVCRKVMDHISEGNDITDAEGRPFAGARLFRRYLINRCQADFERRWVLPAATTEPVQEVSMKGSDGKARDIESGWNYQPTLSSDDYDNRQVLGFVKFLGELFKLRVLTARIMHECVRALLRDLESPEDKQIEFLCALLSAVGAIMDTGPARAHMDVYFSRLNHLFLSQKVSPRMQFMLQDVIKLRDRRWNTD